LTSLSDLMRTRRVVVETDNGAVTLESPSAGVVTELMKADEAEQHSKVVAACAVDPRMTEGEAARLPSFILIPLAEKCVELIDPKTVRD